MSNHSRAPSTDSTRPLNLAGLILAEHRKNESENLAELDAQQRQRQQDPATNGGDINTLNNTALSSLEPGQTQKSQGLASVVDRVRQAQKQGTFVQPGVPADQTPQATGGGGQDQEQQKQQQQQQQQQQPEEQREHWYSTFLPKHLHRHQYDESESSTAAPTQPDIEVVPPKELTTIGHAAGAFASASRANNLETIDFTIESLGVTGAAAPAFLLRTDEKGRRPPPILFQLLKLGIVDSEINPNISRQVVFRIELQYGDIKWVIRRSLYEFYKLHLKLSAKRYPGLPKFPNQVSWALSIAKAGLHMADDDNEAGIKEANLARRKALQTYFLQVLQVLNGTVAYDLYEFLEISVLSLTKDMGWKGKEGYVETKVLDTSRTFCGLNFGFNDYDKSWAILRDSYLSFGPSISSDECSDVFIFDQNFYVIAKEHVLGLNQHHIEIGNSHRKIEIKGDRNREMVEWFEFFQKMQTHSPWVKGHRFGSFAPEREDAKVRYYVDGKDYFHAVSDAILAAKNEIYIADWWLSPELYLRRPPEKNEEFRLDRLLKKKAQDGVKIYVVVYKEITLALTMDSAHTKTWLQDLHPNIQVQRHPDHISVTATQFWAHHEKICVVDCRLAFIGGLDLCFGRYDSRTHQLSDYHPSGNGTIWPGQDYSNPRIKDFTNVKDYNNDLIERKLLGRMPWHDVSIGVAGQPARDIARHFVQRWNFVKREKGMKKSHMKFLTPKGEFVSTRNETGWTGSQKIQILRSSTNWSQGVDLEHSILNAYLSSIETSQHFIYIENQFFVTLAAENGNPDLKNTIGLALVNRIVRAHQEGQKFRVIVVMPLMPAFEADIMSSEAGTLRKVMHFQYVSISRGGNSVLERLESFGINPEQYIGFFGLRSFDRIKHGKFDAIVEAVKEAEAEGNLKGTPEEVIQQHQEQQQREQQEQQVQEQQEQAQEQTQSYMLSVPGADAQQLGGEIRRSKSLASKFLLDPLPHSKEAARIKAILHQRRAADLGCTWDESITKRAMSVAKKEHGYIPAVTERTLADHKVFNTIHADTDRAEVDAKKRHYQGGGTEQSEPHVAEGMGVMFRNTANNIKGTKTQGDLEPKHHIITRNPLIYHPETNGGIVQEDGVDREFVQSRNEAEALVEPNPQESAEAGGETSSTNSEGETMVEDNEVDDFVTEQLYIHSKLMIVDDRIIIIGSANINDRSQVGYRDSEIAIIIEDSETVTSKMNGVEYQAGKIAHGLRTDLFKEHLGLLPHVEHDTVTSGSVLPVDLDAPSKDPAEVRRELIRAAEEEQQQLLLQQQQEQQELEQQQQLNQEIHQEEGEEDRKKKWKKKWAKMHKNNYGHIQVTTPNEDETRAHIQWHSGLAAASQPQEQAKAKEVPLTADQVVMDPLSDDFYDGWWTRVAKTNTEIFREVFHCVPDNNIENWDQYKAFVPNPKKVMTGHVAMEGATVENVTAKLQKVTGHLVEFPTKFLCQENLMGNAVESTVTPMEIFT
ncbi:hypothetical protein KI688_012805 [Linnemannia hyalina]|uniref:Phospholipase n=1 Tax=Linnemannia hyalina TaxID=64524 RepID=A0A9P8BT71_9FUNG|nr:hypothetical protein KI688_012805 [Linnemannia hyalina]